MTMSLVCLPERRSPESSASPMLPPPMIAILATEPSIARPSRELATMPFPPKVRSLGAPLDVRSRQACPRRSRKLARHQRELAGLHDDATLAVHDQVVLVEPFLPDLRRRAHHPQPAL